MAKKYDRKLFLIFGVFFLFIAGLYNWATISTGVFPAGHDIILVSLVVVCFCNAYLAPQFVQNDERVRRIRERGVFISYFITIGYIVILLTLLQFEVVYLYAYQAMAIIAALMLTTVFISFVILARKY